MTQTNPDNRKIFTSVHPAIHSILGKLSIDAHTTRDVVYELALSYAAVSPDFRALLDDFYAYTAETGRGEDFITNYTREIARENATKF